MDDLLEELGVTYNELYKLHTGHNLNQESNNSDSSDDSDPLDTNHKPPLYSFDEINQNVVIYDAENNENSNIAQTSKDISNKLSSYLTAQYCFVCEKNCRRKNHYGKSRHYKRVKKWLTYQLRDLLGEVPLSNFFCEICNLALSGNDLAQIHYESEGHKKKTKHFCLTCLRSIHENDMHIHVKSQKHKKGIQALPRSLRWRSKLELRNDDQQTNNEFAMSETKYESVEHHQQLFNDMFDLDNKSIETNCLGSMNKTDNENLLHSPWPRKLTDLITLSECKICQLKLQTVEKADYHYCSEMHNNNVKNWLDNKNQFGDMANWNPKMFCCAFCDSRFSSEQELNDHNHIHFSAMGSTNSHDGYKKKMAEVSESKKPKILSEVAIMDKPISTTPKQHSCNTNDNGTKLYDNIRIEINKLINSVYFSKRLPLEQSLSYLKDVNQKLLDACSTVQDKTNCGNIEQINQTEDECTGAIKKIILNKPSTSHNNNMGLEFLNTAPSINAAKTEHEYSRTKISMELHRLKMVIGNTNKIPTDLALKYIQNLNELLDATIQSVTMNFEINGVFEAHKDKFTIFSSETDLQTNLKDELDKLCDTLLDVEKITIEVALDFLTQFNVQLESLLQYQEDNDPVNLYLLNY